MRDPWQTKRGNYLLRAASRADVVMLAVAVSDGRVLDEGVGVGAEWVAELPDGRTVSCSKTVNALVARGLVELPSSSRKAQLTDDGRAALDGVVAAICVTRDWYRARLDGYNGPGGYADPAYCERHGWYAGGETCIVCDANESSAPVVAIGPRPLSPARDSGPYHESPAGIAAALRRVAAALDYLGDVPIATTLLSVSFQVMNGMAPVAERVAAIDAIGGAIGMTAECMDMGLDVWHYAVPYSGRARDGVHVNIFGRIPDSVAGCGCSHCRLPMKDQR